MTERDPKLSKSAAEVNRLINEVIKDRKKEVKEKYKEEIKEKMELVSRAKKVLKNAEDERDDLLIRIQKELEDE